MNNQNQIFGHPKETLPFVKEFYCGVCHKIPIFDTWNRSTGKMEVVEIGSLSPVPIDKIGPNGMETHSLMVCEGCLERIKKNVEEQVKAAGGISKMMREAMEKRKRKDEGEDLGQGGIAVPK